MIDAILNVVILLALLTGLVLLHELGHFVAARRAGVTVHEFVRMEGEEVSPADGSEPEIEEEPLLEAEASDEVESLDPRAFVNQSLGTRLRILLAGVAVNFVLAWVIFTVIALVAEPIWNVRLGQVMPDSPAAAAGLVGGEFVEKDLFVVRDENDVPTGEVIAFDIHDESGDLIVAIDGTTCPVFQDLARADAAASGRISPIQYLADRPGEAVTLTVEHADGSVEEVEATLRSAEEIAAGEGALGFRPGQTEFDQQQNGLVDSAVIGLQMTVETSTLILRAVGNIFVGFFSGSADGLADVAGPVGMVGVIGDVRTGLPPIFMLWFIGLISANLAVINLLPIPPLDGSRMVMAIVQAASGNRVSPATERLVYFTGWVALMVFLVLVTFGDIQRLFS